MSIELDSLFLYRSACAYVPVKNVCTFAFLGFLTSDVQGWRFLELKITFLHGDVRFGAAVGILGGRGLSAESRCAALCVHAGHFTALVEDYNAHIWLLERKPCFSCPGSLNLCTAIKLTTFVSSGPRKTSQEVLGLSLSTVKFDSDNIC